jgi:outer membrane lipoprotein-sorting protein
VIEFILKEKVEVDMMKRLGAVLFFFLLFSAVASAFEFSADTVMTTPQGKMAGKMFFKPDRFRMDMNTRGGMSMITRMDKKVVWNVMNGQKMYMEMPFNPNQKNKPMVEKKVDGEIERKQVGTETIDGHPTTKYLITYKASGRTTQIYQWWAKDINFPVKTAALDSSWSQEFRNIKIGAQSDSLFEVPAGYRKMSMPSGMNFKMPRQ